MQPDEEYRRYARRQQAHHDEFAEADVASLIDASGLARHYDRNAAPVLGAAAASLSDSQLLAHAWHALGLPLALTAAVFAPFGATPEALARYMDRPESTPLVVQDRLARLLAGLDARRQAEASEIRVRLVRAFGRATDRIVAEFGRAGELALRADAERSAVAAHGGGPDETAVMAAVLSPPKFERWYVEYLRRRIREDAGAQALNDREVR